MGLTRLESKTRSTHLSVGSIILESAVGREKDVQDIDVHGEYENLVVTYMDVGYADNAGAIISATLLVTRGFSDFPGTSRACADFRDPTAASRIIHH